MWLNIFSEDIIKIIGDVKEKLGFLYILKGCQIVMLHSYSQNDELSKKSKSNYQRRFDYKSLVKVSKKISSYKGIRKKIANIRDKVSLQLQANQALKT